MGFVRSVIWRSNLTEIVEGKLGRRGRLNCCLIFMADLVCNTSGHF